MSEKFHGSDLKSEPEHSHITNNTVRKLEQDATQSSDAKSKCKLHCILKANEIIEKSICIILIKTWFTCLDVKI